MTCTGEITDRTEAILEVMDILLVMTILEAMIVDHPGTTTTEGGKLYLSVFLYVAVVKTALCKVLCCRHSRYLQLSTKYCIRFCLTLSLPQSSIDDLVFSVFPSNFFKLSYKISLLNNRFVTLFFIRFS